MLIGGLLGGLFGGISAAASGKSIWAGVVTGAVTGAVIGGICDGTTLVATAVFGAMAKSAAVAAAGNVLNQTINYIDEKIEYNQEYFNLAPIGTNPSELVIPEYQSFSEYYVPGETVIAAATSASFVPFSVAGGTLSSSAFQGLEKTTANKAGEFIVEAVISGNVSTLQFAVESIISVF